MCTFDYNRQLTGQKGEQPCVSGYNNGISRFQLNVLLGLFAVNHVFVVEEQFLLLSTLLTEEVDLFGIGEGSKSAGI